MTKNNISLTPGSPVFIISFKKAGKLLKIQGRTARVLLNGITIECPLSDIRAANKEELKAAITTKEKPIVAKKSKVADSLDLHGMTVTEALNCVEQYLSDAILAGKSRVEIIHGHGSGRVKTALHGFLASANFIARFEVSSFNTGTTVAYLNRPKTGLI